MSQLPTHRVTLPDGGVQFAIDPAPEDYPDCEIEALAADFHDGALLDAARSAKWAQVKAKRNAIEMAGALTPLGRIDTDADSQRKIAGATLDAFIALQSGEPWSESWRMSDNSVIEIDAEQMIAVGRLVKAHVSAAQACKNALDAAIGEAASVEDVNAIDVEGAAWPA